MFTTKSSIYSSYYISCTSFNFKNFEKSIFLLLGLTFLFATFLSFYHFGIEQGFIEESAVCDLEKKAKI